MIIMVGMAGRQSEAQNLPIRYVDNELKNKSTFYIPTTPHKKVTVTVPDVGYFTEAVTDVCGIATIKLPSLFKLSYDGPHHKIKLRVLGTESWFEYTSTEEYNKAPEHRPKCWYNTSDGKWYLSTQYINWWDEATGVTFKGWRSGSELVFWRSDIPPQTRIKFFVYTKTDYVYSLTKTAKADACGIAKLDYVWDDYYWNSDKKGYYYWYYPDTVDGQPFSVDWGNAGGYLCRQGRLYAPR